MPRWQPDPKGRMQDAALDLFREGGYDSTTVAAIAGRAGLTQRTFYRYFADKREVLFFDSVTLRKVLLEALKSQPPGTNAMEATVAALSTTAEQIFAGRRNFLIRWQSLIDTNPELHERKLVKMASIAADLADVLRERGASPAAAYTVAGAGMVLFDTGFRVWLAEEADGSLTKSIRRCSDALREASSNGAEARGGRLKGMERS